MKPERAQELYSDYAEDTLTPALRQALEQHFDADPAARADYRQFSQIYALLEQPLGQELEAPLGFRAKILERAAEQQGQRETQTSRTAGWLGWFTPPAHRRATGGALAALAVVVVGGIFVTHPTHSNSNNTVTGSMVGGFSAATRPSGLVQSVDMQPSTNAHLFQLHLHLPDNVPAATVNAYIISATEQITDPAHLADATPAVTEQQLNNHQGLEIPISVADSPAGSTLNLLAEYTPDTASQPVGTEAVFTPFGAGRPIHCRSGQRQLFGCHAGGRVALRRNCDCGRFGPADAARHRRFFRLRPTGAAEGSGKCRRIHRAKDSGRHLLCGPGLGSHPVTKEPTPPRSSPTLPKREGKEFRTRQAFACVFPTSSPSRFGRVGEERGGVGSFPKTS